MSMLKVESVHRLSEITQYGLGLCKVNISKINILWDSLPLRGEGYLETGLALVTCLTKRIYPKQLSETSNVVA